MIWRTQFIMTLLFAFLVIPYYGLAQEKSVSLPVATDTALQRELQSYLETTRQKYDLPAITSAIVVDGRLKAVAAVGFRQYGDPTPVTINDKFHLGSNTKSMTATLLAMLVEERKLTWETTLSRIFPELAATMLPEYRSVTVKQLLWQYSGLTDESFPKGLDINYWHSLRTPIRDQRHLFVEKRLQDAPAFPPGTKFQYSNSNYIIAGAIVERIENASWEEVIERKLFKPLGMMTAGFGPMGTRELLDQPRQHILKDGRHEALYHDNPPVLGPAGRVHCSILDFAKYALLHLQGERGYGRLLKASSFKTLHTPPPGQNYAMGWAVSNPDNDGLRDISHGGSNTMSCADMWVRPGHNFIVLVQTNEGGKGCDMITEVSTHLLERLGEKYSR